MGMVLDFRRASLPHLSFLMNHHSSLPRLRIFTQREFAAYFLPCRRNLKSPRSIWARAGASAQQFVDAAIPQLTLPAAVFAFSDVASKLRSRAGGLLRGLPDSWRGARRLGPSGRPGF